jgi:hypothetical protein
MKMVSWQKIMTSKSKDGQIENLRNSKAINEKLVNCHDKENMTKGTVDETAS